MYGKAKIKQECKKNKIKTNKQTKNCVSFTGSREIGFKIREPIGLLDSMALCGSDDLNLQCMHDISLARSLFSFSLSPLLFTLISSPTFFHLSVFLSLTFPHAHSCNRTQSYSTFLSLSIFHYHYFTITILFFLTEKYYLLSFSFLSSFILSPLYYCSLIYTLSPPIFPSLSLSLVSLLSLSSFVLLIRPFPMI